MTVLVINRLEMIEINVQQRQRRAAPLVQSALKVLFKADAVKQPGQRVSLDEFAQPHLLPLLRRHVLRNRNNAVHTAVVHTQRNKPDRAIGRNATVPGSDLISDRFATDSFVQRWQHMVEGVAPQHLFHATANDGLARCIDPSLEGTVDKPVAKIDAEYGNNVRDRLTDRAQNARLLHQLALGAHFDRNIAHDRREAVNFACVISMRNNHVAHRNLALMLCVNRRFTQPYVGRLQRRQYDLGIEAQRFGWIESGVPGISQWSIKRQTAGASRRWVEVHNPAARIGLRHKVSGVVDDGGELPQFPLLLGADGERAINQIAAHDQRFSDDSRERSQHLKLSLVKVTRLAINHAQRPDALPARQNQRCASIKANVRGAEY